ncbi:uncharacterized protein SCODWIG_02008 [Saccharomycodes ludwigii]|uniref:Conserved oligomeric Golgi complex subunit 5 n=1 Tax=Saccharomycodes ludwigii TaxID=36035 RepID=A0A376B6C2_9ASCO|nr:hypothetical protein SCDLUD_002783 [Saccharomycodes ludwigii]KAH3901292.1 hypothetical protein SCDLUD_002783 [Saccharomycodes ludwigii]SSD60247.1 uncharacterized protein SCODWIG_02008 [Saccharomycodes ludwigii]
MSSSVENEIDIKSSSDKPKGSHIDEDFGAYLEESFSAFQFSNTFLKATNPTIIDNINNTETGTITTTTEPTLDLYTPLKKIKYDLDEIDERIDNALKSNYENILTNIDKLNKIGTEIIPKLLNPSVEFLELSYNKLNEQVLKPYTKANNLQISLSKLHQTSMILRDFMIFSNLVLQCDYNISNKANMSVNQLYNLASIHSQIDFNLQENPILGDLLLVQDVCKNTIQPQRKQIINHLSDQMLKLCLNNHISNKNEELLKNLINALLLLSRHQFNSVLDKILLSKISTTTAILNKTITSIKSFQSAFDQAMTINDSIINIEKVLKDIKITTDNGSVSTSTTTATTTAYKEFMSKKKSSNKSILFIYWSMIGRIFGKEFQTNLKRGGPVGKSLIQNRDIIKNIIENKMNECLIKHSTINEHSDKNQIIAIMLNSVKV